MRTAELEAEYNAVRQDAQRLCDELARQVNRLLASRSIALGVPLQARVKSWISITEKLSRLPFDLKSIISLQDLVGLRILLLFRRDVAEACRIIEANFTVVRAYDTRDRLAADQFGYASRHIIVRVPDSWLAVPTIRDLGDLSAEIQVRTLSQHAWAETSQFFQYKRENTVPPQVRRTVARVAALLETVDLELERVLQERDGYRATSDEQEPTELLNVDNLETILDSLLPSANKDKPRESYAVLLEELNHVGIRDACALKEFVRANLDISLARDCMAAHELQRLSEKGGKPVPGRAAEGRYFNHGGLVRCMLRDRFPKEMQTLWDTWMSHTGRTEKPGSA